MSQGADLAAYEMGHAERAQLQALQREWGFAGAPILGADSRRLEDDVVFDEDVGMPMDDARYPLW